MRLTGAGFVQIHRELDNGLTVRAPHGVFLNRTDNENLVLYNNLGFHDRDRDTRSEKMRLTVIGDSFVEGAQVPRNAVFSQAAETQLAAAGIEAEVVNAGTSGSNTPYQYVLWKDYLNPRIETDVLILCLYLGDDLAQNQPQLLNRFLKRGTGDRHFFVSETGEPVLFSRTRSPLIHLLRFLTRHSRVLFGVYQYAAGWRAESGLENAENTFRAKTEKAEENKADLQDAWNESMRGTLALIDRWQREADAEGIRFGVMTIPSWYGAEHRNYGHWACDRFVEKIRLWAGARGVPLLETDLSARGPLAYYSFDNRRPGHFNQEGHAETGRQLAAWIEKNFIETGVNGD